MPARSERQVLLILHRRGARRLTGVRFRSNRSTIWSLTRGGRQLNLHVAYRIAPLEILDHFAVIAREAERNTPSYRMSAEVVRSWGPLEMELRRVRREHVRRRRIAGPRRRRGNRGAGPCCATTEQRVYLRRLYTYLNRTRFANLLPSDVHLRLSNRMRSRLGQMMPGMLNGSRHVAEIALNVDLMLEGNGRERIDTLLHEMAHAAHWLFDGGLDHGPTWRGWARFAGCKETTCADEPIRRRGRGARSVTRVPQLPEAARLSAAA